MKATISKLYSSSHEFRPSVQRKVGILILVSAILGMILVNVAHKSYESIFETENSIFGMSVTEFIDKGLMSIFFFAAGMEIRHEFFHGHLVDKNHRKLPLYCAAGGVIAPFILMAIFGGASYLFSYGDSGHIFRGMPIPIATDIVFALAFLSFFSNRIPKSLRAFVLTFAVIDDLIGLCMLFFLQGSISPTAVAVVLGFLIPTHFKTYQLRSHLLAKLLIVNSFIILPVFALANGGVSFKGISLGSISAESLFWAISVSQIVGKIIGIYSVSILAIRSPKLSIPTGCTKQHMFVASCVAAIGFTLSLYLAKAAFDSGGNVLLISKLAIVVATLIAISLSVYSALKLPVKETNK